MLPYFSLLGVSFLLCYVANAGGGRLGIGKNEFVQNNHMGISAFFLILFIMLACRSTSVGRDTKNYEWIYNSFGRRTIMQILTDEKEVLYGVLNWLTGKLGGNFQTLLFVTSGMSILPIAILYNKEKRHGYLKIVLFINMSLFVMLFSGIRQSIAIAMGVIAFHYVQKKKKLAFMMTVLIAMAIHQSAFMLFALYPLYYARLKRKHLPIIILIFVFVYIYNAPIFDGLLRILVLFGSRFDNASISQTGAITMIILFALFAVFTYIIPDENKVDDEFIGMRNYLVLTVILQCFAPLHVLAMRMNYYYILFIPIVVPMALNYTAEKRRQVAKLAEMVMCVFFTVYYILNIISGAETGGSLNTVPYVPFWNA